MTECWEWGGTKYKNGYGRIWWDNQDRLAHRVAWEMAEGPIPPGLYVLHGCDNPGCVNVEHLRLGDQTENMKDKFDRGRDGRRRGYCKQGHALTPDNVYRQPRGVQCKTCSKARSAARYQASLARD